MDGSDESGENPAVSRVRNFVRLGYWAYIVLVAVVLGAVSAVEGSWGIAALCAAALAIAAWRLATLHRDGRE